MTLEYEYDRVAENERAIMKITATTRKSIINKLKDLGAKVELMETGPNVTFKKAAYFKAANVIEKKKPITLEEVQGLPGIGTSIFAKINEIVTTGALSRLDNFDNDFSGLLKIDGVGPKKAKQLFGRFGCKNASDVMKLIKDRRLDSDEKFNMAVVRALTVNDKRLPRVDILGIADPFILHLRIKFPQVIIELAGSIRRQTETSKDVDILVCGDEDQLKEVKQSILNYNIDLLAANGNKRVDVIIRGVMFNIRLIDKKQYGPALLYFTGSGDFNIALRSMAKKKGYKLSEYGLFTSKGNLVKRLEDQYIMTEDKIFEILGYNFIPPCERIDGDVLEKYKK